MKKSLCIFIFLILFYFFIADINEGLVAYYPFTNGSTEDFSGNGNHGINYGAVTTEDRFNNENFAYYFDDNNHYIELSNPNNLISNSITHSAWFKSSFTDGEITGQDVNHFHSELQINGSGQAHFWMEDQDDDDYQVVSTEAIIDDSWHHVAGTYNIDTGYMAIYIDGILIDDENHYFTPITNISNFFIGSEDIGHLGSDYFHGKIDDVRIYNRPLSESEMTFSHFLGHL